ncbi:hypothetical protein PVAP13_8NG266100 [Panicum virgatum]|uniref:Uncharacterized protein n=1 Tax=Panicum virgatum TaxID=38727 RepID=A0A8T0P9Z2_PANVG|nr:hypothetical protein PVAP13_8NG266100 [Panicum virgatum]
MASTPAEASTSTLSPLAHPFFPDTGGRSKAARWSEDAFDEEDLLEDELMEVVPGEDPSLVAPPPEEPRVTSYRDVVLSPPRVASLPPTATAAPAQVRPLVRMRSPLPQDPARRRRPTRHTHRRRRRPAQLLVGLPVRGEPPRHPRLQVPERLRGRLGPLHAGARHLGAVPECHGRHPPVGTQVPPPPRPRVDTEGFQMVQARGSRRHASQAAAESLSAPAATL